MVPFVPYTTFDRSDASHSPLVVVPHHPHSDSSKRIKTHTMNFFGQKEEKPKGPDPLFAGTTHDNCEILSRSLCPNNQNGAVVMSAFCG